MKRSGRKQEWSMTMFAFGGLMFFPPLLSLFDKPVLVLGLPLTYMVLFGVWALIIFGIWLGALRSPLRGELPPVDDGGARKATFDAASTPPQNRPHDPLGQG